MQKEKIETLVNEKSNPCLTISLNTHKTYPDNALDRVVLKNLLKEAKDRLVNEFGIRPIANLLERIDVIEEEIDVNYNLESLHLFLSDTTQEIIKSPWPIEENSVQIGEAFAIRPLIKALNRTEEYLILLLSQSGVSMFRAMNDLIYEEVKNVDFPFAKNLHYLTNSDKLSDGKQVDNMVREFLNEVDKAVVKETNISNLNCVVVCTENNYSRLLQVADKPAVYCGHILINYNDTAHHTISAEAWEVVKAIQKERRKMAIEEIFEAVKTGNVITDLSEIYKAVKEGRGDLLITHEHFQQAVKKTGESSFEIVTDATEQGVTDDITSEIAWEVISKKGRAIFTSDDELKSLGEIALKVRY